MAQVVITRTTGDTPAVGGLFSGLSFFLVQRLPSRSTFIEKIQSNGGRVVKLEAQANHIVADHFRQDSPPGSISYTFIDAAIRDGELPNPDDHPAGRPQGTAREIGSAVPGKNTRTPFTAQDDRELWQWVERCKTQGGARVKGNEIYKQLEARNSRHTFQAWRDRYVKKLMDKPPVGVNPQVSANAPPSPPTAQDAEDEISADPPAEPEFTDEELQQLLQQAEDIEKIQEENVDDAWGAWAEAFPEHSAESWRAFYDGKVRPSYLKNVEGEKEDAIPQEGRQASPSRPQSSGSQKRKRGTPTSAKTTYGRKKHRSNGDDVFGHDSSDGLQPAEPEPSLPSKGPSTQAVDLSDDIDDEDQEADSGGALPNSELEKAALRQLHVEQPFLTSEINLAAQRQLDREETFPTSDMNKAAQLQLNQEEAFPTSDMNRAAQGQLNEESALLTSDANATAENAAQEHDAEGRQELSTPEIQRQAAQAQFDEEVLGIPRSDAKPDDVERDEELEEAEEDPSRQSTPDVLSSKATIYSQGSHDPTTHALTAANLQSQQAQHSPPVLRASDLPEDDEGEDDEAQDEYIKFLSNLNKLEGLSKKQEDEALPIAGFQAGVEQDAEPEIDTVTGLPLSSQQEIDDVFEMAIKWPESPPRSQRKEAPQSQSQQFETQVVYPTLTGVRFDVPESQEDEVEEEHEEVVYPELPEPSGAPITTQQEQGVLRFSPVRAIPAGALEGESSFVLVDDELAPSSSQAQFNEDDVDLSIPEPESGWDASSSPVKNAASMLHERDDIHLSIPEPEDGWDTSSSPAKDVRLRNSQSNTRHLQHGSASSQQPNDEDGEEEDELVHVEQQEIVELSSTSPSSSSSDSDAQRLPTAMPGQKVSKRALETQDILNAETQLPDFDMPLPPDSDAAEESLTDLPSDPADLPGSPEKLAAASQSQALSDSDFDSYVEKLVTIEKYTEGAIIQALKRTSMNPVLAEMVLMDAKLGNGFPNLRGIWSEEEDTWLESGNARILKQLEVKHGWEACEERMRFLEEWRE